MEKELQARLERIEARQERIEAKLDVILAYVNKVNSPQYQAMQDSKDAVVNGIMNLFIWRCFENNNNV